MTTQNNNLAWPLILTFLIILGWIAFEGILTLVVGVGLTLTLLWVAVGASRVWPAIQFRFPSLTGLRGRLLAWSAVGGLVGLTSPLMILSLMIFKTGIHAHGPEFNPAEIEWVLSQFFRWSVLGMAIGFGVGLLVSAFRDD
ncbi:MAG: hypothetical protein AB8G95_26025 [Anaerolineae bacterium]